jgi:multidrug resistance efflux pump
MIFRGKNRRMFSPNRFQVLFLAGVLAALLVFATSCGGSKANVRRDELAAMALPVAVDVTTAPAIMRDLPRFFEATGSLAGDEQTDVAPQTSGKVVAVGVDLGSHVTRGQMIARLDDVDLKLRVQQAQAQLDQAKAALVLAEEKIGIKAGQPLDPNKVPEVVNARVALELAEKNLHRAEKLIESGDVSRASYDQQRAQRDQLKEVYESTLSQARQNYAAAMNAQASVANAESQLNLARRNLSYTVISSPIDGYVAQRNADVGEYVTTSSNVATVVRINPLRIRIDIPEQAIPEVRTGQSVSDHERLAR